MSFKREGDDKSWLNLLQKRRVSELLAFDIPEDEALLTRNGKYTCLVCYHRPVFDTANVLAVHRAGKRHIANYEKFMTQKEELRALKAARRHEEYVKRGKITSPELLESESEYKSVTLMQSLGSAAYDPRVKKRKITERKSSLQVENKNKQLSEDQQSSNFPEFPDYPVYIPQSTLLESLPGTSKYQQEKSFDKKSQSEQNPTSRDKSSQKDLSKNVIVVQAPNTITEYKRQQAFEEKMLQYNLKPYVSKKKMAAAKYTHKVEVDSLSDSDDEKNSPGCEFNKEKEYITSFSSGFHLESCQDQDGVDNKDSSTLQSRDYRGPVLPLNCNQTSKTKNPQGISQTITWKPRMYNHDNNQSILKTVEVDTNSRLQEKAECKVDERSFGTDQLKKDGSKNTFESKCDKDCLKVSSVKSEELSLERRKHAQNYLQATSSGWKRDHRTGTWIQDEDAEFDSDEEPPEF